jgi:hypothetical protein
MEKAAAIIVTYINYVSRRHPYATFETIIWASDYEMKIVLDMFMRISLYSTPCRYVGATTVQLELF